jgi:hypothetical protein
VTRQVRRPDAVNINDEVAAYKPFRRTARSRSIYSKSKAAKFGYPDVNFEYAIVKPNQSSNANYGPGDSDLPRMGDEPCAGIGAKALPRPALLRGLAAAGSSGGNRPLEEHQLRARRSSAKGRRT